MPTTGGTSPLDLGGSAGSGTGQPSPIGATVPGPGCGHAHRGGTPPEASYSVVRNPQRFAPLHDVATALIEHLVSTHEVTLEEGRQAVDGLLHPPTEEETVRAVRLTPRRETSAPVAIVLTDFPGVHAGGGRTAQRRHLPFIDLFNN